MDDLHARFHVVILTTAEDKRLSPRYLEERFAGVGLFVCRSDLGDEALEIDKIADDSPPSFGSHMLEVDLHRRALGERAADPHDTCTHGFELLYIPAGGTRLRGLNVARGRFALSTLSASATVRSVGELVFRLPGKEHEFHLQAEEEKLGALTVTFHDETNGDSTDEWRKVSTARPRHDGSVILDFNRAINYPSAFTPYGTCPMPVKNNSLDYRIEAGEKDPMIAD
jgi:hypothetical protein